MKNSTVAKPVISRLPRYYRFLCRLSEEGKKKTSSKELAELMGLTSSQIRQDLNNFGVFGQKGSGYEVSKLKESIEDILGLNKLIPAVLIGAGNLGRAVSGRLSFNDSGFRLIGIFDSNPVFDGISIKGLRIQSDESLESFCAEYKPVMAVLCIPEEKAEATVDKLVKLGIKCFWNFTHFDITRKYPDIVSENVHLSDSIMNLSYYVKNKED